MSLQGTRFSLPKIPPASPTYSASAEQAFRRTIEAALSGIFVATNIQSEAALNLPLLGWSHTLTFSATDHDTVAWTSGSILLPNGTVYSIGAGNTGNITTVTYVFLDISVSTTVLQLTTSASAAVGAGRILIAVANNVAVGKSAQFQVLGGKDDSELTLITASVIAANTVTANEMAANTITAAQIAASTITANEIAAATITGSRIAAGTITAANIAALTITAAEIAATTITGDKIASLNISTKTITADTGTIGGWTLSASELLSGSLKLQATGQRILVGSATDVMTGVGIFIGLSGGQYQIRAGDPAGAYFRWSGSVLDVAGAVLTNPGTGSSPAILGWNHTMVFSATDHDTVAWTTGSLRLQNGSAYVILSGDTGNITALTYIYLDADVSLTTLQTTTTASAAVGHNKILVAVAQNVASGKKAEFQVFGGSGSVGISKLILADNIAANTITANEIFSNTITSNQITGTTLSAIRANLGTITAGKIDVGNIEINADTERILFGSATDYLTGSPGIFMGLTGGAYKFRVGDVTTKYIGWDGTDFTVAGGVIVAATSFTATTPVFSGSVEVNAGDGEKRIKMTTNSNNGQIDFYGTSSALRGGIRGTAGPGVILDTAGQLDLQATLDLVLTPDTGGGTANYLVINNLPTSTPGGTNRVWRDAGVLKIT